MQAGGIITTLTSTPIGGKPIDVRIDFGCKGDAVADDTACLQAALDAGGIQGRRVYIPAGTYSVSEPLLLKGSNSPGRYNHSDQTPDTMHLYISLAILYTEYTGWRQNDFNVYA
jgi:hypothetical protein